MIVLSQVSMLMLLLVFLYISIHSLMQFIVIQTRKRTMLRYVKKSRGKKLTFKKLTQHSLILRNTSFMLETIHSKIQIRSFMQLSMIMLVAGILLGSIIFTSMKGVIILGLILCSAPYIVLRMKIMSLQMKSRIDFLPAVEVFYQQYVLSSQKNIRIVLGVSLQQQRIMYPMKPIFEQLFRNLTTHRDTEESLRIFTLSLGHTWADYFVNMLRVGLEEGVVISNNMKELIRDMRRAQRASQVERNRLLEIRIANFTPVLFLGIFLFINFQMNYSNAFYYYLVDTNGRNMLLDAILLIFVSFIMGLYLSIKRM